MSEQRQKIYKLYEAAKPQLSRWFAKWENQSIFQTFYEGVSPNLSQGTNSDGLGLVRRYHPNWWINDGVHLSFNIGGRPSIFVATDSLSLLEKLKMTHVNLVVKQQVF